LSDLLSDALREAAVRRLLNLVMPALIPRRLDLTELLTLILGGDRSAPTISESNSPAETQCVPQSTATHIFMLKFERVLPELSRQSLLESSGVELETSDHDVTDDVVSDGLRAPTAVVMSEAADRPQSVRRRSLISAVGRQLLKVNRRLCCWWCVKK